MTDSVTFQELIDNIRKDADIVQVVSSYIKVSKKGNSYVAVCPFHADKHPSMQINPSKQIYKCFACGAGGNVFTFVQNYEHVPFMEAVRKVADICGIVRPELTKSERTVDDNTKRILLLLKDVNEHYQYVLQTQDGKAARDYLDSRNIPEEVRTYYHLGFSSNFEEVPIKLLRGKGYSVEEIEKAGILLRQGGKFIDFFHGRLMFPIYNEYGDCISFSGRNLTSSHEDRYKNGRDTAVFTKNNVLYNYQNAKIEARNERRVYVTEGFMDVFALYQAGKKCSVALMGTAFTRNHADLLRRLNCEIVLCLDGDDAGQKGMIAAGEVLRKEGLDYRVINYKDCRLDPDEILQTYGKAALAKFLERIMDKNEFIYNFYKKQADLSTIEGRTELAKSLIPYLSKLTNVLERQMMVNKIAQDTGVDPKTYEGLIATEVSTDSIDFSRMATRSSQVRKLKRLERIQNEIMYCMLTDVKAIDDYIASGSNYFLDDMYLKLSFYVTGLYEENNSFDLSSLITTLSQNGDAQSQKMINLITTITETEDYHSPYTHDQMMEYLSLMKKEIQKKDIDNKYEAGIARSNTTEDQLKAVENYFAAKKGE